MRPLSELSVLPSSILPGISRVIFMDKSTIQLFNEVRALYDSGRINLKDERAVKRELSSMLSGGEVFPSTKKWLQTLVKRNGAAFLESPVVLDTAEKEV